MQQRIQRRQWLAGSAALMASGLVGAAESWPARPVTIVVPSTPGGAIDTVARLLGQRMGMAWGQSVVIDNRAGASGIVGTEFVAKAPADGYTLGLVPSSHAINPSMYRKLPFDAVKSFEPVIATHALPLLLVVPAKLPVADVAQLVAFLKAQPGQHSYASSGTGGAPHMSAELFKVMAKVDVNHVPYRGSTAAHPDLIAGRTSLMFDTVSAVAPHVKSGALRALAVSTTKRSVLFAQVPTMAEAGIAGYETSTWGGLLAPAGTPRTVVARVHEEAQRALQEPELRERLLATGIEPLGGTPEDFGRTIRSELARWAAVARDAGIQPEG